MMNFLFEILGFLFIFMATDVGRPREYRVKLFSFDGFIQWLLVVCGVVIILKAN